MLAPAIRWLSEQLSRDTYLNVMQQYRPEYEVGETGRTGDARYREIDRRPAGREIDEARQAARDAGLWRFDHRS